ncbi:MAG: preprotein translocase subunit SecE [Oscillospiraceae bacterium]|nr:preprotein translocase subunit SecE [Oscillospiraceae bacterium]
MAKDKELNAATEEKGKKDKKSKKSGGIGKWFKDLKIEMSKVVWPSKKTVFNNSVVVLGAMFICALLTFLLDRGFLWLLEFAISG